MNQGMQLLVGPTDEHRLAGLIMISKGETPNFETLEKISKLVGSEFFCRLMLPTGKEDQIFLQTLALDMLTVLVRVPSIVQSGFFEKLLDPFFKLLESDSTPSNLRKDIVECLVGLSHTSELFQGTRIQSLLEILAKMNLGSENAPSLMLLYVRVLEHPKWPEKAALECFFQLVKVFAENQNELKFIALQHLTSVLPFLNRLLSTEFSWQITVRETCWQLLCNKLGTQMRDDVLLLCFSMFEEFGDSWLQHGVWLDLEKFVELTIRTLVVEIRLLVEYSVQAPKQDQIVSRCSVYCGLLECFLRSMVEADTKPHSFWMNISTQVLLRIREVLAQLFVQLTEFCIEKLTNFEQLSILSSLLRILAFWLCEDQSSIPSKQIASLLTSLFKSSLFSSEMLQWFLPLILRFESSPIVSPEKQDHLHLGKDLLVFEFPSVLVQLMDLIPKQGPEAVWILDALFPPPPQHASLLFQTLPPLLQKQLSPEIIGFLTLIIVQLTEHFPTLDHHQLLTQCLVFFSLSISTSLWLEGLDVWIEFLSLHPNQKSLFSQELKLFLQQKLNSYSYSDIQQSEIHSLITLNSLLKN